ncbi:MAG: NTP transferase domain-containing protein [Candidatus Thermoplasmatota archaeon]|nr:NTP transferase domain-containing protein [Candidatus Thermoplasmatota archaeon]
MKAFILAAGKGTRMRPLTEERAKPMLPVGGKPILQHLVDNIEERVDEIVILVGWGDEEIKENITSSGSEITYTRQEDLLGTADAVSHAEDFVDERFICMNGDIIVPKAALNDFIDFFSEEERCCIGMAEVEEPEEYGVVYSEGDEVTEIVEKPAEPKSNVVNAGLYGFTPEIFSAIENTAVSPRGEYEITDSLEILIERSQLRGFKMDMDEWYELSRPWDLLSVNKEMMNDHFAGSIEGKMEDNVHIEGEVHISDGAKIKEGAYIKGPVYIGEDAQIGPNCLVRPSTYIGKGCKVGNAVEVKNSIIMEGTQVPHHNYVGDSVIGRDCNFGSGTKVANLRLDDKNIVVTHRDEKIDTGRRKLGVIMGDEVKTGVNSMMNPGTIIWSRCFIGPGALAEAEVGTESKIQ